MRRLPSLSRLAAYGCAVTMLVSLAWLAVPAANADWYDNRAPDARQDETTALIDPYDPLPEIDSHRCAYGRCLPHGRPHLPPPPVLPGVPGHATFLVDCGAARGDPYRGLFTSLDAAVHFAPPNATILILPPGQGTTCVESVHINKPLTIGTYGGGEGAVIQAPPRRPCLVADIPLGDTLTIDGVRFIARGERKPCILVQAGHVVMRNAVIDSRSTNWAFNVAESGELTVQSTRVETDGSGVCARRAHVELHNLDIDITERPGVHGRCEAFDDRDDGPGGDPEHAAVGLWLDRTDGTVDGGSLVGGTIGILASAGTHGLELRDLTVRKARTGVALMSGGLGGISANRLVLANNVDGLVVAPGAESQVIGSLITDSHATGMTIYGAGTLISGNKVVGAHDGIVLSPPDAFPPPYFAGFTADALPSFAAVPIVENNLVANVHHAAVSIDARTRFGRVIGNNLYASGHARCIDDRSDPIEERANHCHGSWLHWPF